MKTTGKKLVVKFQRDRFLRGENASELKFFCLMSTLSTLLDE